MGIESPDAQGLAGPVDPIRVTWEEVFARLAAIDLHGEVVYGIPRGGMIASAFLKHARVTHDPGEATWILDDIHDSGATFQRWVGPEGKYPGKPFHALRWKQPGEPWIIMPWESELREDAPEDAVVRLLQYIGEDPKRDGLLETPKRVTKALREMCVGYGKDPATILSKDFQETSDQLILVKDIPFHSLCEHHMLPFSGVVTVGYLPRNKIVGLSKIPRLVHAFARRLQVQERMTNQIAEAMVDHLQPEFVGVLVRGHHSCMSLRGVESSGDMITSAIKGTMRMELKDEFFHLAGIQL